ncbi:hypothetical protein Bhyg_06448 [Pseudolycoriella hygida]|uniref:THAP-type domain-containing protein n=1 Tax=Pseudolycoriella hygida TaxID=35572 RepID=A0A9Q0N0T8_9DIPT|nr:hypothetical protein Bhyg_06448 [Pseudolycoriella hygida]
MKHCCVPKCKSKWTKNAVNKKYHMFPKEENLRKLWIQALGVKREPKYYTAVCSDHFKVSDYTITQYGEFPGPLRRGTVPSRNLPNSNAEDTSTDKIEMCSPFKFNKSNFFYLPAVQFVDVKVEAKHDDKTQLINCIEKKYNVIKKHASTMANIEKQSVGTLSPCINMRMNYNLISDSELIYATGFERSKFNLISDTLEKYSPICANTVCEKKNSLFMTMFMLHHSLHLSMVEFIFGHSRNIVSAIITELVEKLHLLFKRAIIWDKSFEASDEFQSLLERTELHLNGRQ